MKTKIRAYLRESEARGKRTKYMLLKLIDEKNDNIKRMIKISKDVFNVSQ